MGSIFNLHRKTIPVADRGPPAPGSAPENENTEAAPGGAVTEKTEIVRQRTRPAQDAPVNNNSDGAQEGAAERDFFTKNEDDIVFQGEDDTPAMPWYRRQPRWEFVIVGAALAVAFVAAAIAVAALQQSQEARAFQELTTESLGGRVTDIETSRAKEQQEGQKLREETLNRLADLEASAAQHKERLDKQDKAVTDIKGVADLAHAAALNASGSAKKTAATVLEHEKTLTILQNGQKKVAAAALQLEGAVTALVDAQEVTASAVASLRDDSGRFGELLVRISDAMLQRGQDISAPTAREMKAIRDTIDRGVTVIQRAVLPPRETPPIRRQ